MITKEGNKWKLDIRPNGVKGKRIIRLFDSKGAARQFERMTLGQVERFEIIGTADDRQLDELIELWFNLHGRGLKSAVDRKQRLFKLSAFLGNPIARLVTPQLLSEYRNSRLDAGISPTTLNHELGFLKALYSELKRLSVIDYDSSIIQVKKLRVSKSELAYLVPSQIKTLMTAVDASTNESLPYVVKICLVTGARWSEAERLTVSNCINQGFQFVDTKNGKNRFVPVEQSVFLQVKHRLEQSPFKSSYWSFRVAFARSELIVPDGQLSHILRHTFASHFIMNGGNVVALQKILGHSSLNVTMRYSHLSPDYLEQAIHFNPLAINKVERKRKAKK